MSIGRFDISFGIGTLQAYKHRIRMKALVADEYIHCVVTDWIEKNNFDQPITIKVDQIFDLQMYLEGRKMGKVRERILRVGDLTPVHFIHKH